VLPVPQLTAPGTVEALPLLPSFLYLPHPDELAPGELALPWTDGQDARCRRDGAQPRRHHADPPGVLGQELAVPPRRGPPRRHPAADAPEEVTRVSPLDASTRYLAHLRQAWNARIRKRRSTSRPSP
jgi:hypothetical protein